MIQALKLYILSGYGYDNEAGAFLVVDDRSCIPTLRTCLPIRDRVFTIREQSQRFCVGNYDLKTFRSTPCPDRALPQEKTKECSACAWTNGFNPSFYNVSRDQLSPQQRFYNERPHQVYLAYFGTGVIKVGISNAERMRTRLLEQGARMAVIVCLTSDAYEARSVEASINCIIGLPDAFRSTNKRMLLNSRYDHQSAKQGLLRMKQVISAAIPLPIPADDSILDFTSVYLGKNDIAPPVTDLTELLPHQISGRCLGMIGDVLIMEQSNRQFILALKQTISHLIAFEEVEHQNTFRPPIQERMF